MSFLIQEVCLVSNISFSSCSPATHSALSVLLRELKARSLSSLTNIEAWMDVFTREFTKLMVIRLMKLMIKMLTWKWLRFG